jgi:O-antigen ligase
MLLSEIIGVFLYPNHLAASVKTLVNFIEFIIVFLYVLQYCCTIDRVERVLKYAVLVGVILLIITIWEVRFGVIQIGPHYTIFGNRSPQSEYEAIYQTGYIALDTRSLFALSLVLWYSLFILKPKWFGFIISIAVIYIFAISTRRDIYIAVIGFFVALFWLNNRKYLAVFAGLVSIMAFMFVFSNPQRSELDDVYMTLDRLSSGELTYGVVSASTIRFNVYIVGIRLFLEHPLWGYGMGGFAKEMYLNPLISSLAFDPAGLEGGTGNESLPAHSQYLQILVDYGLVVFTLFVLALWILIKRSYRLARMDDGRISTIGKTLFVCQVGWAFGFIFESLIHASVNVKPMFFYITAALTLALWRITQKPTTRAIVDDI